MEYKSIHKMLINYRIREIKNKDFIFMGILLIISPIISYKIWLLVDAKNILVYIIMFFYFMYYLVGWNSALNAYKQNELSFLYSIGVAGRFLWIESYIRKSPAIIVGIWMTISGDIFDIKTLLYRSIVLLIPIIIGYLIGRINYLALLIKTKTKLVYFLVNFFLVLLMYNINILYMIMFIFPLVFIEYKLFIKSIDYIMFSIKNVHPRHLFFNVISPILKKELSMLDSGRFAVIIIVFIIMQILNVLFLHTPLYIKWNFIDIESVIWISLLHDAWTINILGLEDINIGLYSTIPNGLRKLILYKFTYTFIIIGIFGIVPEIVWFVIYGINDIIIKLINFLLFHIDIEIIFLLISIRYAKPHAKSYYKIYFNGFIPTSILYLIIISIYFFKSDLMYLTFLAAIVTFISVVIRQKNIERLLQK